MAAILVESVGRSGRNARADVLVVQALLNANSNLGAALGLDGVAGSGTLDAIDAFQRRVVGLSRPDGRVDPGGRTLGRLVQGATIQVAVGAGCQNRRQDVIVVQSLLNAALPAAQRLTPDGLFGNRTGGAIRTYQAGALRVLTPDGRVDPSGRTLRGLTSGVQIIGGPAAGAFSFPFPSLPTESWKTGARAFGSSRSKGKRKHAGCDLYFPEGTWIYAVADGDVIQEPYAFYCETEALEVRHGTLVVRYGEIKPGSFVGGTRVTRGQRICQVGHLVGITVPSDMLHIELYAGTATGPLTVRDNQPYQRRSDLVDPTPYLDAWALNLPAA